MTLPLSHAWSSLLFHICITWPLTSCTSRCKHVCCVPKSTMLYKVPMWQLQGEEWALQLGKKKVILCCCYVHVCDLLLWTCAPWAKYTARLSWVCNQLLSFLYEPKVGALYFVMWHVSIGPKLLLSWHRCIWNNQRYHWCAWNDMQARQGKNMSMVSVSWGSKMCHCTHPRLHHLWHQLQVRLVA